jgi:hypothetical protein
MSSTDNEIDPETPVRTGEATTGEAVSSTETGDSRTISRLTLSGRLTRPRFSSGSAAVLFLTILPTPVSCVQTWSGYSGVSSLRVG